MATFTLGVFVVAKLLDSAGGPSGRNVSVFRDRIAGLPGAAGVALVVAIVDTLR